MKPTLLTIATALALGALAGCDRNPAERTTAAAPPPQSNTPSTPANIGQPQSLEEKKEGANPVQGQVDPKQAEQHKDFQSRGDGAGPRGPDTEPKRGG
jgi:hypothetical protein